jgi:hypothetical protein
MASINNIIYASANGSIPFTEGGLYKSTDAGSNWSVVSFPFQSVQIVALFKSTLFALTNGIIYLSTDNGINWSDISDGLTGVSEFQISNEYLYAKNSIWEIWHKPSPLSEINTELNNPIDFVLEQNFPNPFNSSTIINYGLKVDSKVNLKIFDLLGREIKTIINEEKPKGNYLAEFNATGLPSGVYLYKMEAVSRSNIFRKSHKMIYMK